MRLSSFNSINTEFKSHVIHFSLPKSCIYCNTVFEKRDLICSKYIKVNNNSKNDRLYITMQCELCEEVSFFPYIVSTPYKRGSLFIPKDLNAHPFKPRFYKKYPTPDLFNEELSNLSPNFIEAYSQAQQAEDEGLDAITGPAYRKAVEFIVKDFLIYKHPEQKDEIKKEFLSKAINRIDDARIKTLARATTYIGNDLTHYDKRDEQSSVESLKGFLLTMLYFINANFQLEKAHEKVDK